MSASSCRNAAGDRIAVRARLGAGAPPAGVPAYPQIMNGVSFPQLAARDLGGREVALPAGLPGERNVVLIASGVTSNSWSARGGPGWNSGQPPPPGSGSLSCPRSGYDGNPPGRPSTAAWQRRSATRRCGAGP
jgi:hypothetical protein